LLACKNRARNDNEPGMDLHCIDIQSNEKDRSKSMNILFYIV